MSIPPSGTGDSASTTADPCREIARVFAAVPAAGRSRRMGQPKLLLPLGDRPVIAHLLDALRGAHVKPIVVVLRSDDPELEQAVRALGGTPLVPPDEPADMRASIQHAVRWITGSCEPTAADALLVVPADVPGVGPEVIGRLIDGWRASTARIVVPVFEGRRGHPVLLAWSLADEILALPEGVGLNVLVRRHEQETVEWPVATGAVLEDLDSPADYESLKDRLGREKSAGPHNS